MKELSKKDKDEILNTVREAIINGVDGGVQISIWLHTGFSGYRDRLFVGTVAEINLSNIREIIESTPLRFQNRVIVSPGDCIVVTVVNGNTASGMVDSNLSHLEIHCDSKTTTVARTGMYGPPGTMTTTTPVVLNSKAIGSWNTWRSSTVLNSEEEILRYSIPTGQYLVIDSTNPAHRITGCLISQAKVEKPKPPPVESDPVSPFDVEIVEIKEE